MRTTETETDTVLVNRRRLEALELLRDAVLRLREAEEGLYEARQIRARGYPKAAELEETHWGFRRVDALHDIDKALKQLAKEDER
ncbi:hypothetical protein [Alicyclobacillus macrosporangiidus]|uniref:hypothetical protein n=1 Tax=Alicyclobacillus macrosporangiidus TaxID=392015 RepID=UPI000497348B|nr:hypothetical protein [Alicyclobacillus macrosporangiidus]